MEIGERALKHLGEFWIKRRWILKRDLVEQYLSTRRSTAKQADDPSRQDVDQVSVARSGIVNNRSLFRGGRVHQRVSGQMPHSNDQLQPCKPSR